MRALTGTLVTALLMLGLATRGWSQVQSYTNEKRSGNSTLGSIVRDSVTVSNDSVVQRRDLDVQAFGTKSTVLYGDMESARRSDGTHYERASVKVCGSNFFLGMGQSYSLGSYSIMTGMVWLGPVPVSWKVRIGISASHSLNVSSESGDLKVSDGVGLGVTLTVAAGCGVTLWGFGVWAGVEGSATILGGRISFDATHHAGGYTDAAIRGTIGSSVSLSLFAQIPWFKWTWTFARWTIWEYTLFECYLWGW